ncbi:MAG: hypothetical protein ACE366_16525 [Bradymonadia bacterium]
MLERSDVDRNGAIHPSPRDEAIHRALNVVLAQCGDPLHFLAQACEFCAELSDRTLTKLPVELQGRG